MLAAVMLKQLHPVCLCDSKHTCMEARQEPRQLLLLVVYYMVEF
jgi:hypothetical protein